jgi:hypothetical protein
MSAESELLSEILKYEHRGSVKAVAQAAVCAESTIYSNMDGKANPSVWVIKAAFEVTGDPRLKKLLEPDGWELVRKKGTVESDKPVEAEAMDVVVCVGDFVEDYRRKMDDGRLETHEAVALLGKIATLKTELDELEAAVMRQS